MKFNYQNGTRRLPMIHDLPYVTTYSWEKAIDFEVFTDVVLPYWSLCYVLAAMYVVGIFKLKSFMEDKRPYKLDTPLIVWNSSLALFSIICFSRGMPEIIAILVAGNGHHHFMCYKFEALGYTTAFWGLLYGFSKLVEFGDTVFLVLRKKKLIFLHWYHHVVTFLCVMIMALDVEPTMVLYGVLNCFVHFFMYTYFALNAGGVKFSRTWAKALTTLQLTQMGIGYWAFIYPIGLILIKGQAGADCPRNPFTLILGFVVGLSYIFLFGRLYYLSYMKPKRRTKELRSNQIDQFDDGSKQSRSTTLKKID